MARWVVASCAVLLLLGQASVALARTRLVLLQLEGRKAEVLREKLEQSLKSEGHAVVLSPVLTQDASPEKVRQVAETAGASAVISGHVVRHSVQLWSLSLRVHDARTGKPLGEETRFKSSWLPGLAKQISDSAGERLSALVETAQRPAEGVWDADESVLAAAAEPPSGSAASEDSLFEVDSGVLARGDAGQSPAAPSERTTVHLRAQGGMVRHSVNYVDDLYSRLRTQSANIWVYRLEGAAYPFARPIGERLGLIASYESVIAGSVRDADLGANFEVEFSELLLGLRARHPFGPHQLGFDLTFGRLSSGLADENDAARSPDVDYTLLRSAFDVTVDLGKLRVIGAAGFRLPLGYGEISELRWFPRVGGYGVEAALGVDYPVSRKFSVELDASARRFVLEMNSEPSDALQGTSEVAGGAVDLYLSAYVGMTFRL